MTHGLTMEPITLKQTCVIEGCDNRHIARGFCPKHYYHARKAGFIDPPPLKWAPTRFASYCTQDGCGGKNKGHGLCSLHYARWKQRGRSPDHLTDGSLLVRVYAAPWKGRKGPESPRWTGDSVNYYTAHKRIRAAKGLASDHACIDCGKPAAHWSYVGGDPDERRSPRQDDPARMIVFSLDSEFYQPRCVADHHAFDRRS